MDLRSERLTRIPSSGRMARSSGEYQPISPGCAGIGKGATLVRRKGELFVEDPRDSDQVVLPPQLRRSERRVHFGILPPEPKRIARRRAG